MSHYLMSLILGFFKCNTGIVRATSENNYVKEAAEARLSSVLITWCRKVVEGLDFRARLPECESQPIATCWGNFSVPQHSHLQNVGINSTNLIELHELMN